LGALDEIELLDRVEITDDRISLEEVVARIGFF
jgi:hypothetical protein